QLGQPVSAAPTAATSSAMETAPSLLPSNAGQSVIGRLPSAILTPSISSLTVTAESPLQSPTHAIETGVDAGDGLGVPVVVDVPVLVVEGVLAPVGVVVGVSVVVTVGVAVGIGGTCAPLSYAPISHADPYGRGAPR